MHVHSAVHRDRVNIKAVNFIANANHSQLRIYPYGRGFGSFRRVIALLCAALRGQVANPAGIVLKIIEQNQSVIGDSHE
jgi:hypothetical protein